MSASWERCTVGTAAAHPLVGPPNSAGVRARARGSAGTRVLGDAVTRRAADPLVVVRAGAGAGAGLPG